MSVKQERDPMVLDYDGLRDAFARFGEASARLEDKYNVLLEETKILRETLRQKDLEIKRQEKLALLGETAAAIAHEVRNPLGSIKLFVSLLKKDLQQMPGSLTVVEQIETSIGALNHVVSNILQFSKERTLHVSPVNLHSIIQEQLLAFPRSESNQAHFELSLNASPYIIGNDSALRQVFYNLILNALQATNYRGRVQIETQDYHQSDVCVFIRDNGPGISREVIDKLFDPFVTTKNEGTGLGLSIVKQIVSQHGGVITCDSEAETGATFVITVPRNFKEKKHES